MNQKGYSDSLRSIDIDKILTDLSKSEQLSYRLLEIREDAICWEIDNPFGHNLYVVKANLTPKYLGISDGNLIPSIDEIIKGHNWCKKSANLKLEDKLPMNTCLIFSTANDLLAYTKRACKELYKSYEDVSFLFNTIKTK